MFFACRKLGSWFPWRRDSRSRNTQDSPYCWHTPTNIQQSCTCNSYFVTCNVEICITSTLQPLLSQTFPRTVWVQVWVAVLQMCVFFERQYFVFHFARNGGVQCHTLTDCWRHALWHSGTKWMDCFVPWLKKKFGSKCRRCCHAIHTSRLFGTISIDSIITNGVLELTRNSGSRVSLLPGRRRSWAAASTLRRWRAAALWCAEPCVPSHPSIDPAAATRSTVHFRHLRLSRPFFLGCRTHLQCKKTCVQS